MCIRDRSNYVKHTSQETSRSYAYTKSAKKSTLYYMRGKKDDCSTSSDVYKRQTLTYANIMYIMRKQMTSEQIEDVLSLIHI